MNKTKFIAYILLEFDNDINFQELSDIESDNTEFKNKKLNDYNELNLNIYDQLKLIKDIIAIRFQENNFYLSLIIESNNIEEELLNNIEYKFNYTLIELIELDTLIKDNLINYLNQKGFCNQEINQNEINKDKPNKKEVLKAKEKTVLDKKLNENSKIINQKEINNKIKYLKQKRNKETSYGQKVILNQEIRKLKGLKYLEPKYKKQNINNLIKNLDDYKQQALFINSDIVDNGIIYLYKINKTNNNININKSENILRFKPDSYIQSFLVKTIKNQKGIIKVNNKNNDDDNNINDISNFLLYNKHKLINKDNFQDLKLNFDYHPLFETELNLFIANIYLKTDFSFESLNYSSLKILLENQCPNIMENLDNKNKKVFINNLLSQLNHIENKKGNIQETSQNNKPSKIDAIASINIKNENELIKKLLKLGATYKKNTLTNKPIYNSSHELKEGLKLQLKIDQTVINYIPHNINLKKKKRVIEEKVTGGFNNQIFDNPKKVKEEVYNEIIREFKEIIEDKHYLFGSNYLIKEDGKFKLYNTSNINYEDVLEIEKLNKKATLTVKENIDNTWIKKEITIKKLTQENIAQYIEEYNSSSYEDLIFSKETGLYMPESEYRDLNNQIIKLEKAFKEIEKLNLDKNLNDNGDYFKNINNYYQSISKSSQDLIDYYSYILLRRNVKKITKYEYENVLQDAINSEKGTLKISNINNFESINNKLELGQIEKEVAYNLIYTNNNKGIVPIYDDNYLDGTYDIPQPTDGQMIIHGLTGCASHNDIINRLQSIQKYGGLKSTFARRQTGIQVRSESPIGDMASGIDMGVPCKIGYEPFFGDDVHFVLKPSVLARKKMFFALKDFGAGNHRNHKFQKYAQKLGQEDIYNEASHNIKLEHLRNLDQPEQYSDNEIYIENEISLNEIDSIFVTDNNLYNKVCELVDYWKKNNLVSKDLKIRKKVYDNSEFTRLQTQSRSKNNSWDLIDYFH